jgi:hypothetical protein
MARPSAAASSRSSSPSALRCADLGIAKRKVGRLDRTADVPK